MKGRLCVVGARAALAGGADMGVDAASRDGPSSADFVGAPDDGREMHADNLVIDAK